MAGEQISEKTLKVILLPREGYSKTTISAEINEECLYCNNELEAINLLHIISIPLTLVRCDHCRGQTGLAHNENLLDEDQTLIVYGRTRDFRTEDNIVGTLVEVAQGNHLNTLKYEQDKIGGRPHCKRHKIIVSLENEGRILEGVGTGSTIQRAKHAASFKLMKKLIRNKLIDAPNIVRRKRKREETSGELESLEPLMKMARFHEKMEEEELYQQVVCRIKHEHNLRKRN